jgi:hypothetical protein
MPLESVTKIVDLNELWPLGSDQKLEGDDHIRNLKKAIKSLLSDVAQIGFKLLEVTLTAATTNIDYTGVVNEGAILTVIIRQDSTGGRQITWASKFKGATTSIDVTPNKASVFQFVGKANGDLLLCSLPVLGLSI